MQRALLRGLAVLGVVAVSTSCGTAIRSGGTPPPGSDFGVRTFAWASADQFVVGDARLRDSRFFEDRLHEAVEWELSLRGIRYDESSPDLLVHYHLALAGHELAEQAITESGYTAAEVYAYEDATVVVHLVDAETHEDVWVGWAQARIEQALRGPEEMRTWVYSVVHRMFAEWEPVVFIEGVTALAPPVFPDGRDRSRIGG